MRRNRIMRNLPDVVIFLILAAVMIGVTTRIFGGTIDTLDMAAMAIIAGVILMVTLPRRKP